MTRAHKKKAAARARAARWPSNGSPSPPNTELADISHNLSVFDDHSEELDETVDYDSSSDCDYDGGINWCLDSEGENDGDCSDDWEDSDDESLVEFNEDDLVEIKADIAELKEPSAYDQIMRTKSSKEWKAAEKNRNLGYTGTSKQTQQRNRKNARDQANFHEQAKTS